MSKDYLTRQTCGYCFRMRVPKDLQTIVGKTELRYTLNTGSLRQAKRKSKRISRKVKGMFEELREGKHSMTESTLTKAKINEMVKGYVEGVIEETEDERTTSTDRLNSGDVDDELDTMNYLETEFKEALAYHDFSKVYPSVNLLLEENSIQLDVTSDSYLRLCHEMLKASIYMCQIEKKQIVGDYSYQTDFITPSAQPQESVPEKPSEPLSKIVEAFWNEKQSDWKPRSQTQYRGVQKWLIETLGPGTQIHTIGYQTGRDVKEKLIAKKNQGGKPLSKDRVNLYLNHIAAIWNWAMRHHYTEVNPFSGLQLSHKTTRVDELRDVFTVNDLKKLFVLSAEHGQDKWGRSVHPHFFWIPLLGLFTGCRLEEICQLYVEDVKRIDDVWCLDINENKPDKSVKKGERRIVPVHLFMSKELNFIGYVKSLKDQKGRVFPELKRVNDRYGHSFGQWFSRFKKRNNVTGKKAFHSFRHLVVTSLLEKDVPDFLISQLVGHVTSSITTSRYGKRFKPKMLFEKTVKKLDFGIDLSHLKKSKYITS